MRRGLFATLALILMSPAHAQTAPKPVVIGQVHELPSKVLGQDRRITVRLPTGDPETWGGGAGDR